MYCCTRLNELIHNAGSRGIAILVRNLSGVLSFVLQSRGIDIEDEDRTGRISGDVKINLSCEIGIVYCPFCGTRLQDLIAREPEFFAKLAESHSRFLG